MHDYLPRQPSASQVIIEFMTIAEYTFGRVNIVHISNSNFLGFKLDINQIKNLLPCLLL